MAMAAGKPISARAEVKQYPARTARQQKLPVVLVTTDETLWPKIGAELSEEFVLKQVDSVAEFLNSPLAGPAAVLLWDARHQSDHAQVLTRLNLHAAGCVVIALDAASGAGSWTLPLQHRQVMAHVALPITGSALSKALDIASEEARARAVLLGDATVADPVTAARRISQIPRVPAAVAGVLLAGTVAYLLTRHGASEQRVVVPPAPSVPLAGAPLQVPEGNEEKLDALIDQAQQAMAERHFIEPITGSALALYRDALVIDPDNGEARQGLQRLAEILLTRVQTALDDRKFDAALQSLETARSIYPADRRLAGLDEKIASLRAELGPAQIMAALNAQNFDRAAQLIDDAARAKSLPAAKLSQLRDEVRRRREDFDQGYLLKLAESRLQQGRLIEPKNDNAAFYLDQARQAGAPAAQVQAQLQDLQHRLLQDAHAAIEQHRYADVERSMAQMRGAGLFPATVAALQRDLTTARNASTALKPERSSAAELAQARLAQGKLSEPQNDSALFYLTQLKSAEPGDPALASLSAQAQGALLQQAGTALDAGDVAKADTLLQQARSLGPTQQVEEFAGRLRDKRSAAGEMPQVAEQSLTRLVKLEINYPERALQSGIEGWVQVAYSVKTDGGVADIRILGTSAAGIFDQAATKAVARLRYQPVMRDGTPTPVGTQIKVTFRIPR